MPRRARVVRREVPPDPRYGNRTLQRFINKIMYDGKKSTAERVFYGAMDLVEQQLHRNPVDVFELALRHVTPVLEVKPRRVGGATYQVPVEIRPDRRAALARRWIVRYARGRSGKSFEEKLAGELMDAANGVGAAIKRREETHKMAESNKAFSHFRY